MTTLSDDVALVSSLASLPADVLVEARRRLRFRFVRLILAFVPVEGRPIAGEGIVIFISGRNLLWRAHALTSLPSTVQCSSGNR